MRTVVIHSLFPSGRSHWLLAWWRVWVGIPLSRSSWPLAAKRKMWILCLQTVQPHRQPARRLRSHAQWVASTVFASFFQSCCCWALCLVSLNCNSFSSLGDELQTLFSSRCNLYWDWITSAQWANHVLWHQATMQVLQKGGIELALVLPLSLQPCVICWAQSPQYLQLPQNVPNLGCTWMRYEGSWSWPIS